MRLQRLLFILSLTAMLTGCASRGDGWSASPLLDRTSVRPVAGERGWNYEQTWSADFDGDGDRERLVVLAQVERSGDRILWEDGHTWAVYVEEPSGDVQRTYLFSRLVPMGRLEVHVTRPEENATPRILILERAGGRLALWEVRYRGRENIEVRTLADRELDPSAFVRGE